MFVSSLSGNTDAERRDLVNRLAQSHCFVCPARDSDFELLQSVPSYVLRVVTRGAARVVVDGHGHVIDTNHYHIANPSTPVQTQRLGSDTRVLVINITPARFREVHRSVRDSAQRLLHDDSAVSQWPVRFHQRARPPRETVSPLLDDLSRAVELGVIDTRWVEGQYSVLAERLLFDEYRQQRCGRSLHRSGALAVRLQKVKHYMENNYDEALSLADLARIASVSPHHFLRSFKRVYAMTPHRYLVDLRLRKAQQLLETTNLSVREIGTRIGFASANGFHSAFRNRFGCSPNTLRPAQRQTKHPQSRRSSAAGSAQSVQPTHR